MNDIDFLEEQSRRKMYRLKGFYTRKITRVCDDQCKEHHSHYIAKMYELPDVPCNALSPETSLPCHLVIDHEGAHEAANQNKGGTSSWSTKQDIAIYAQNGYVMYQMTPEVARLLAMELDVTDSGWAEDFEALLWAAHQAEGNS
jgi:hypothetical protein